MLFRVILLSPGLGVRMAPLDIPMGFPLGGLFSCILRNGPWTHSKQGSVTLEVPQALVVPEEPFEVCLHWEPQGLSLAPGEVAY